MMFAETEHLDVFDDDHFVVADREQRSLEQSLGIFAVSLGKELHGFMNALGRVGKALAGGVFAEADQCFTAEIFVSGAGECGAICFCVERGWLHRVWYLRNCLFQSYASARRNAVCAGVYERVHHRLFDSYSFQMRVRESPVQYFEDLHAEI